MRRPHSGSPDDVRAGPWSGENGDSYLEKRVSEGADGLITANARNLRAHSAETGRERIVDPLQNLVEALVVELQADGAAIAVRAADGIVCKASAGNAPPIGSRPHASSGLTRWCFEAGRVVLCSDAATDFRINPSIARSLRLVSALAVPIRADAQTIGVVEVFSSRPSAFDDRSIAFVELAAQAGGAVLEEQSAERRARRAVPFAAIRPRNQQRWLLGATASLLLVFTLGVLFLLTTRSYRANNQDGILSGSRRSSNPIPSFKPPASHVAPTVSGDREAHQSSTLARPVRETSRVAREPESPTFDNQRPEQTAAMTLKASAPLRRERPDVLPTLDPMAVSAQLPKVLTATTAIAPTALYIAPSEFVPNRTMKAHSNWVTGVAFSADGQRLASASWDRTVKLWDVNTGEKLSTIRSATAGIQALAFSRDGRWLAAENSSNSVTTWDATTGQPVRTFAGRKGFPAVSSGWVYSIAFSPDGRWLASGVDSKTVRLWDVHTGERVRDLAAQHRPVIYIAFSPDGRLLASGDDDKSIGIWETATGRQLATLRGHKQKVYAAAFSPDGRLLASASADRTVKLWDVRTGREVATLTGHRDWVTSVGFSPDGRRLASGSWDNTIKIWDVASRREQQTLKNSDRVYSVAFDSRGHWLASGGEDGRIQLWRLAAPQHALTAR